VSVRKWSAKRKLTPTQLAHIREALRNGSVMEELALRYGVSVTTIWRIKIGYTYKNAPSDTATRTCST
jgi:transposase-like protein